MKAPSITRILATAVIALPSGLFAVDTDSDGLDDSVETNTGVYLSPTNTGTNPLLADSDADGAGDWYEVATIETNPANPQPNAPNSPGIKPNIPYPLPAPDGSAGATNKPVKVYIMSGQSNMVGQGNTDPLGTGGTLATITRNEHKFPNLRNGAVIDGAGYSVRNDVAYRGVIAAVAKDQLKVGQGNSSTAIGPELGFGHVMGYFHDEPVLLLKSSQGGRALGWDFLPPGSVQYAVGTSTYAGFGDSPASWTTGATPVPTAGFYGGYQFDQCFRRKADWAPAGAANAAVFNATDVLDNFATEYPQYAAQGFEIAGFVWWQGWNDGLSYTKFYADRYEVNMAQFIRQIRSYYESRYPGRIKPKAPFVLATCGFDAWSTVYPTRVSVASAQLAVGNPVKYPEFAGNVKTMEARNYWRDLSVSPANQNYHYHRNAETFMLVGDALGRGMIDLLASAVPDTTPPGISVSSPADNATGVAASANLVLTFTDSIALGTGNITLKNLTDGSQLVIAITDATQVSASGSVLTINPTVVLAGGKNYAIRIDATAIKDSSNNPFAGIADDTTWNFTTAAPDITAPAIATLSPADNATNVANGTNLVLTFTEAIAPGTGNIILNNLTDGTQLLIAITDATQVSASGSVLTINPTSNLTGSRSYAIQMDATAIRDLSNNPFAGIAGDTTWNFATAAPPASAEILIVNQVAGFLGSDKTQVATAHNGTNLLSYNATGVDKLVVAIGTESGFNNNSATVTGVKFNGIALTQAVQENTIFDTTPPLPGDFDGGTAAIYYLDSPFQGAGTFTVSATTSGGGLNGGWVSIIGLSGTLNGVGNTGKSWATQAATGSVYTSITPSASASLVIAMVENSGRQSGAGIPAVVAPLTLSNSGNWGSQWGSGASGYQKVPASGTAITPTFSTNAGGNIHVVAAEFLPLSLPQDNTAPTLVSINDDKSGGPVTVNTLVTYTVTFSEDMDDSTVAAADFGNTGASSLAIGTVTETSPGVFTVTATPTTVGTLQLPVNAGAVLKDVAGNSLVTTSAIGDDTPITVRTLYGAWSGTAAFDADTNNDGVQNGIAWLLGAANPSVNASGILPKPTNESGKLVMTFRCLKSGSRGGAVLKVQYSNDTGQSDLWSNHQAVVPDTTGTVGSVFFDIAADAEPDYINVRAEIPASAAYPGGKVFGRLYSTDN